MILTGTNSNPRRHEKPQYLRNDCLDALLPTFATGSLTEGAISGKDTKEQGTEMTLFVSFGSPSQGLPSEASKSIAETAEAEDGLWMSVAEIGPPRLVFF